MTSCRASAAVPGPRLICDAVFRGLLVLSDLVLACVPLVAVVVLDLVALLLSYVVLLLLVLLIVDDVLWPP